MTPAASRVLLIGRSALLSDTLAGIIESAGMRVVNALPPTPAALESIADLNATFAVVEAGGSPQETVALLQRIRRSAPLPLLVIGPPMTEEELIEMIQAGCCGYVDRDAGVRDLLAALQDAGSGRASASPRLVALVAARVRSLAQTPDDDRATAPLTARELEVLALAARGASNKEIATVLGIWLQTVKSHLHNIYEKLDVRNRREAVASAIRHGMIRAE
jgi:two-component system, NarL family, nitrate/nitrite response regulator NarL